jgi:membrane associated rhomboid family serine protease
VTERERGLLRVVRQLADLRGARLLALDRATATILLPSGLRVELASADAGSPDALADRLRAIVDSTGRRPLALVVVGGGRDHARAASMALPAMRLGRTVAAFALDDRAALVEHDGARIPELAAALRDVDEGDVDLEALRGRIVDAPVADRSTPVNAPIATMITILACVGVHVLQRWWAASVGSDVDLQMGALTHDALHRPWQWLAYAWLHVDPVHLLANVVVLFFAGRTFERLVGWQRFALVYTAGQLGGAAMGMVLDVPAAIGASAGVWAIFAGLVAIVVAPHGELRDAVDIRLFRRVVRIGTVLVVLELAAYFSTSMVTPAAQAEITFALHGAGAIAGIVVALGLTRGTRELGRGRRLGIAARVAVVANAVAVVVAMLVGRPWDPEIDLAAMGDDGIDLVEISDIGLVMPVPSEVRHSVEHDDDVTVHRFGDIRRDVIEVTIYVSKHGMTLPSGPEHRLELEALLAESEWVEPDGVLIDGPAWPTYMTRRREHGLVVIRLYHLMPQHILQLVGRCRPGDPQTEEMLEGVLYSLRPP